MSRETEIHRGLKGVYFDVSPNTLSARLKALEAQGIVASRLYREHPPRLEYYLTDKGRSLGPVVRALRDWGQSHAE